MLQQSHVAPTPEHARTALAVHAAAYVVVNILLVIVDLQTGQGVWFHWPLLGWGAGLAWHGFVVSRHVGLIQSPKADGLRRRQRSGAASGEVNDQEGRR